jgi:N-acetylglucosaminyldiphosphoundecaprenol N-acetyl-beta-D-mannosaminyltransferase
MLGVGISFSFVAGAVARAPAWMQAAGLEWVHRLAQEPRRLARRYLVEDLPFAARLFAGALATRARRRP